jgi:zinc/manganese transport system substrate-binding protein/manganese/iron transport system substrate-binding protein
MPRSLLITIVTLLLTATAHAQLEIATSFSILEDLVQNVGGARVNITNFVPRDGDAHTYQPSTSDVRRLTRARVVFINGRGLEAWFAKLARTAASTATVVTLADGLPARRIEVGEERGEADPHLWWNLQHAIIYVGKIRDALIRADPQGRAVYAQNAARYARDLANLDAWAKLEMQKIPASNRKLVTNHDALGYFAARYGLTILGQVIPSFGTEVEPSARETAGLINVMRRNNVRAIFTENTIPPKLAQQIAEETGARVAPALYTDALGAPGSSGETFLKAFRHNVTTIVTALR